MLKPISRAFVLAAGLCLLLPFLPPAYAGGDIQMLPPSSCPNGGSISGILGWDGVHSLSCMHGFTIDSTGNVTALGAFYSSYSSSNRFPGLFTYDWSGNGNVSGLYRSNDVTGFWDSKYNGPVITFTSSGNVTAGGAFYSAYSPANRFPGFFTYDRSGNNNNSGLYRSNNVTSLWDNSYGNVISYNNQGAVGIGTTSPAGTLDIENRNRTAMLCLNGNCTPTLFPADTCHMVTNIGRGPYYISDARCSNNEFMLNGGGWVQTPSAVPPGCPLTNVQGFIHTSAPDNDMRGWSVDGYGNTASAEACTVALAVCCRLK